MTRPTHWPATVKALPASVAGYLRDAREWVPEPLGPFHREDELCAVGDALPAATATASR